MAGLTVQSKPSLKYFTQSVIYKHTKLSRLQTVIKPLILFFQAILGHSLDLFVTPPTLLEAIAVRLDPFYSSLMILVVPCP